MLLSHENDFFFAPNWKINIEICKKNYLFLLIELSASQLFFHGSYIFFQKYSFRKKVCQVCVMLEICLLLFHDVIHIYIFVFHFKVTAHVIVIEIDT